MEENSKNGFSRGLGPRVDALEVALRALAQNDGAAEKNIRMIAESLRNSSFSSGLFDVFEAASMVGEASAATLIERTRGLITILRRELSEKPKRPATILLVGEKSGFMQALGGELEKQGRDIVYAATATQVPSLLMERDIAFIALDLFLPDQDGRLLLETLRSKPWTASIPITVLAAKGSAEIDDRKLVPDAEALFVKPADPAKVAEFINSRLRRAREVTRSARRDVLTGLLNRAAFCESFESALLGSQSGKEPVALALLEPDGLQDLRRGQGDDAAESVLRIVGRVLSSTFRATDIVARWNANQFAVMLPGEDQYGGMRAMNKAMQALRQQSSGGNEGGEGLSLSGGLSVWTGRIGIEEAMEEADHFLYASKAGGGNRVMTRETTVQRRTESVMVFVRDEISKVLRPLLAKNGFNVSQVADSPEAMLGSLATSRCRLILIEEENGGESGFELLARIRENQRFNRIPVVMLVSNEDNAALALGLGANDYLLKPFIPTVFVARMRHLLTRGVESRRQARTVLIMDPDPMTLIIAGTTIHKTSGLRVLLATSGTEGLERLRQNPVDAVLMDPVMPDSDGPTLVQRVLDSGGNEKMPVVLAATADRVSDIKEWGGKDVRGVLVKPYNLQQFSESLMDLLGLKLRASIKTSPSEEQQFNDEIQRILQRRPQTVKS